jgi:hypothetical protein
MLAFELRGDIAAEIQEVGALRAHATGQRPNGASVPGVRLDVGHLLRLGVEMVRVYLPAEENLAAERMLEIRRVVGTAMAPA